eukprot:1162150-Pelagomonas_calceolata.AAC.15
MVTETTGSVRHQGHRRQQDIWVIIRATETTGSLRHQGHRRHRDNRVTYAGRAAQVQRRVLFHARDTSIVDKMQGAMPDRVVKCVAQQATRGFQACSKPHSKPVSHAAGHLSHACAACSA